jgi:hypothetical protein
VEAKKTKSKKQAHENKKGTTRQKGEERKKWGSKKIIERLNIIKVHYMHVWKCHSETSYFV